MKSRSCGLVQRILPLLTLTPAGDKPPRYIFPWTTRCQLTFRRELRTRLDPVGGHPGLESGTCFRTNEETGRFNGCRPLLKRQRVVVSGKG